MKRTGQLLLIMILPLAGCSLHSPTRVQLPVDPPQSYVEAQGANDAGLPVDRWWMAFNDVHLNRLMDELFAENLELSQAIARMEQVEAVYRATRSDQSPSLSAGASVSRSRQPGLTEAYVGDNYQLSLAAGYELDLWGKLAAQSRAAGQDLAASQQDVQTLYLGLSARLADLYFLAVEQRAQLVLADQVIESYADTVQRVDSRYRRGLVPAVDMYQARQSLAGAKAARPVFEARLAEAEHAISVLTGHYPERTAGETLAEVPAAPELFAVGIPADLISHRPDLQASLQRVAAADERVAVAIADRFPSVSLSGSYGTLRQEVAAGLVKGEFWSLLGNLAMPVIDGGRRRAAVDRNEAVLREAIAAYQQKVLTAFQEVEDALSNNYASWQRVELLAETAKATGASLRLSTDRYLAGLDDYLPVLTAQRADADTRSRLIAAQRQLLTDRISLARALGGGWMLSQMDSRLQIEKEKRQ